MKHIVYILSFLAIISCNKEVIDTPDVHSHNHTHVLLQTNGFPSMTIPDNNPLTIEGIELGRKLFYDPILSGDSTQSCSSCHLQEHAFSDPKQFSIGIDGIAGNRNASALVNPGWLPTAFWDGRANSLEEQALGPVPNPIEMHQEWTDALIKLNNDSLYSTDFKLAFGETTITKEAVAMALAQFERTLISDQSRYDLFLNDQLSLTPLEAAGFNLFFSEKAECFHCHGGPLFSDNDFHNNGLDEILTDPGYMDVTKKSSDDGKFRSPTLRNIEFSAPYMHDGRFQTLEEVIDFYSEGVKTSSTIDPLMPNDNGGFHWTPLEKTQLIAFLKALSDTTFIQNPKFSNPW